MFSSALKSFSSNISANYQISPNPTVYSGPWKIHDAKKKSTGTAASVFIFDRKSLETRSGGFGRSSGSSKKLQDDVIERLKREASNLARLRHPSVLQVLEPVEETRSGGLMFATEHLTASLSGLLLEKDDQENTTRAGSRTSRYVVEEADGTRRRRDVEIDELEIQKGLLQVAKGLEFLHESAGLVHGNLNPDAIYINAKSDWKISGLGFAGPPDASETRSSLPPLAVSEVLYQEPRLPASVQLNLDYTSPDFAMDSNVSSAADLFSLGLVIIALYNSPHVSPLQTNGNLTTYKKLLSSPSSTPSQSNNFLCSKPIPKDLLSHVLPRLITRRPAQRMNAREFQQSQYFDNVLVSTIRFLESLPAKNPNEKSQFLRGLQRVLSEFPVSVLERKLLGALMDELKDRELLPLILQNVFGILQRIPNGRRVFPEKIIPRLKEVFGTGSGKGAAERDSKKDAGLMVVLDNMKLIADNCSGMEFKDDILPLIRLGLDSPTHSVVDASLKCLPVVLPVLDFSTVKNEVFPPIAATFSRTSSLAIKVRSLEAFSVLCGASAEASDGLDDDLSGIQASKSKAPKSSILDKYTIQEKLVPSLKAIKTKEPSVMMASLKVFRQVGTVADTEFLALEVLPVLWSFSLGPLLSLQQFNAFMSLIKTLSMRIEQEQSKKLQELSSGAGSTGFQNGADEFSQSATGLSSPDADAGAGSFERLVLGKKASPANGQSIDMWGSMEPEPAKPTVPSMPPSFSWSSNNGGMTPQASALSQQSNIGFRSITPDQKLGSFPSLAPARQASPVAQVFPAMQPSSSIWGAPTNANIRSNTGPPGQSFGSMSTMTPSNHMSGSTAQSGPNYSSFSIPPPPAGSTGSNSIRPPPVSTSNRSTSFQGTGAIPQQGTQKNGLDKYESLI
ncbi:Armadillo-like helical [Penicillium concentricum]|uniref:Armadillo-like helical n=1 Tax=Penicillium concentricum TaxID=293559 RepID=A0A9W9VBK5_9EURO|nr:Armadillo-like helical [Penicillium concentricum]KAJ5373525.1 Armadillo-like helical [Penicillium concentricum]